MEFRLPVPPIKSDFTIGHRDPVFLLGSCFTENIGQQLAGSGFHTCVNPFGIVYDPLSLFAGIREIADGKQYTEQDLSRRDEFYFSYRHHGSFSDTSAAACLLQIEAALLEARGFLPVANVILITLGTAFVYEHAATGQVVANCHKMPASEFRRRLITVSEIVRSYEAIRDRLPAGARVIFTVSPVRHWKDGAAENSRSKAILISAVHELTEQFPGCSYFPAYELLIDDLRDYRFYARDMLHPGDMAIEYIWERFTETYFDAETRELARICAALNRSKAHRPLFPESGSHRRFEQELQRQVAALKEKFPFIHI